MYDYGGNAMAWKLSRKVKKKLRSQLSEETFKELMEEIRSSRKRRNFSYSKWLMITFGLILLISIVWLYLIGFHHLSFGVNGNYGTVGDFINGFSTPIVSFLALIAAALAFGYQSLQLQDLRIQDKKQRIENQFFQLLNLHNEIVNSMNLKEGNEEYSGREYFRGIYKKIKRKSQKFESPHRNKYHAIMRSIDNEEQGKLHHYYRNMYQLFCCIYKKQNVLTFSEQQEYINILTAQISYYENNVLYFNAHFYGADGFLEILNHYGVFNEKKNKIDRYIYELENEPYIEEIARNEVAASESNQDNADKEGKNKNDE